MLQLIVAALSLHLSLKPADAAVDSCGSYCMNYSAPNPGHNEGGCMWTTQYSCPWSHGPGMQGRASNDGSTAYDCCCVQRKQEQEPCGGGIPARGGPYEVQTAHFHYWMMDWTDTGIDVVYPAGAANQTFPMIAYAHGYSDDANASYFPMFQELASWGFVVIAPKACKYFCLTLPPGYGDYYKQQLRAIDWAKETEDGKKLPINFGVGVGVAGHSMGGQATLFSAAYGPASHDIRTAVMHHPYTHSFPSIETIPFLVFTGTSDATAYANWSMQIFNDSNAFPERGIVNKIGADHVEPSKHYNPQLGWFTVAWFKVYLELTPVALGVDFHDLLFGTGAGSLCHGGDGAMAYCKLIQKAKEKQALLV